MALSKETLAKIHELLATEMVERLEKGSVVRTDAGLVEVSITAAEMNVIRQFLKDNGIDKAFEPDSVGNSPFDKLVAATHNTLSDLNASRKAN